MISQIDLVDVSTCKKAKLGRRVVQLFIDFFLVFIVSFSLYAFVCQPIVNALPITAKNNQTLQEKSEEVTSIIEETHLQKRGENGRLVPLKTGAQNYVKSLVKTSCLTLGIDYYQLKDGKKEILPVKEEECLTYSLSSYYPNDDIRSYFLVFRKKNASFYDETISDYSLSDLYDKFILKKCSNYVSDSFDKEKDVLLLDRESTTRLLDYFAYQGEAGKEEYENLVSSYETAIREGVAEVENHYVPYKEAYEQFKNAFSLSYQLDALFLFLAYLVGFLLVHVVLLLCFRGQSLGMKVYSMAYRRTDLMEMRFPNHLIHTLVLFVEEFCLVFLMALMLNNLRMLSIPILGPISLMNLAVFSFLVLLVSLIFFFVNKNHQTLSEYASLCEMVDLKEKEDSFYMIQERENNGGK